MIPCLREAEDAKRRSKGDCILGTIDGTEKEALLLALRDAATDERNLAHLEQHDDKTQDGQERGITLAKLGHFLAQLLFRHRGDVERDYLTRGKSRPIPRGGTWHALPDREFDVAGLMDYTSKTMVIAVTGSLSFHAPRIPSELALRRAPGSARYKREVDTVPEVLMLR